MSITLRLGDLGDRDLPGRVWSSRPSLPISALVPADAIAMFDLRWQEVRSDHLLKQFAVLPRPATVLRNLGVSLDTAETVIAFSTSLDASNGGDTLIVSSPTSFASSTLPLRAIPDCELWRSVEGLRGSR